MVSCSHRAEVLRILGSCYSGSYLRRNCHQWSTLHSFVMGGWLLFGIFRLYELIGADGGFWGFVEVLGVWICKDPLGNFSALDPPCEDWELDFKSRARDLSLYRALNDVVILLLGDPSYTDIIAWESLIYCYYYLRIPHILIFWPFWQTGCVRELGL